MGIRKICVAVLYADDGDLRLFYACQPVNSAGFCLRTVLVQQARSFMVSDQLFCFAGQQDLTVACVLSAYRTKRLQLKKKVPLTLLYSDSC